MKMRLRDSIGLPVETQHGRALGKVIDVEIDIETHVVMHYCVDGKPFVKKLLAGEPDLLIAPTQVISITAEKMIVEDGVVGQSVDVYDRWSKNMSTAPQGTPAHTMQQE